MMAKCELLAKRIEDKYGPEVDESIVQDVRAVGSDAKRMLDAIVASVDRILAMEAL